MADDRRPFVERAAAAIAAGRPREVVPKGPYAPAAPPGFRFELRERVIDLASGDRGFVTAAYPGSASGARVYEVQLDRGELIVRVEHQLEPWVTR